MTFLDSRWSLSHEQHKYIFGYFTGGFREKENQHYNIIEDIVIKN